MPASNKSYDSQQISNDIDDLVLRYLHLTDQYQTLRSLLNTTQSAFYQSLSRANVAPDRGIATYGADRFDQRMQASRLCRIEGEADESKGSTSLPGFGYTLDIEKRKEEGIKDPISMFAVLPPPSLRAAQKEAVDMVGLIPRIVEVQREMGEIEIRVKRGRKYMLKSQQGY